MSTSSSFPSSIVFVSSLILGFPIPSLTIQSISVLFYLLFYLHLPCKMTSASVTSGDACGGQTQTSTRTKCTYEDCYRYFANEKDMKAHKKREPSHEYCSRCDVDCEDDSELLIHMIESGRHGKTFFDLFAAFSLFGLPLRSHYPSHKTFIAILLTMHSGLSHVWTRVQKQRWSRIPYCSSKVWSIILAPALVHSIFGD
jgi:hypothetical protein